MIRTGSLAWLAGMLVVSVAGADPQPPQFRFQKGQTLTYKVEQTTNASETSPDEKSNQPVTTTSVTKLSLVKHWKVADIDGQGVATLELSLASMRLERTSGTGETDVFDSAKPDADNQQEMARLIGRTLAVVRVGPKGDVVEVKESTFGPASRFTTELPFKITLPATAPTPGQSWERSYAIKLDPPQGTGETYQTTQKYTCKEPANGFLVIGVSTSVKDPPANPAEQIPLLPLLPEGEVYFHPESGLFYAARFKIKKEIANHQGEGSKYAFVTAYSEDYVAPK